MGTSEASASAMLDRDARGGRVDDWPDKRGGRGGGASLDGLQYHIQSIIVIGHFTLSSKEENKTLD